MPKIRNTIDYPRASVNEMLDGYVIGTESGSGNTKNYFFLDMYDAFKVKDGKIIITEHDVDTISSAYDYHGGLDPVGDWVVVRYLKSDLTKTVANLATSPTFGNLSDAWDNKELLNYN